MKKHIVYFEIGGHKMRMKITAPTEELAKESVRKKIIFHKVESDLIDKFEKMFDEIFK